MELEKNTRASWLALMTRIASPVWEALARGELKKSMPVEALAGREEDRRRFTGLEALGRSLAGVGPWLEAGGLAGEEEARREAFASLARRAIIQATDPASPDFLNFSEGNQPLVDAAFLAQGLLRARRSVWEKLDAAEQRRVIDCLHATRKLRAGFNNWLLFAATIEAFLCQAGEEWDRMRVDYAIRQHEQWYAGDGAYGDGPWFHWDYYNGFVIQPMLLDTLDAVSPATREWEDFEARMLRRAQRYAAVQERLIAPDGTFPPLGRSLAYRFGAFQALAQMALRQQLPDELRPAQVRCALDAMIERTAAAGLFDADGWLRIGLYGHQPSIGEPYISTGSLYLCLCAFLPLGLPPGAPFWRDEPEDWTAKKVWSGQDVPADHALADP